MAISCPAAVTTSSIAWKQRTSTQWCRSSVLVCSELNVATKTKANTVALSNKDGRNSRRSNLMQSARDRSIRASPPQRRRDCIMSFSPRSRRRSSRPTSRSDPAPRLRRKPPLCRRDSILLRLQASETHSRDARSHHSRHASSHPRRLPQHGCRLASQQSVSLGSSALRWRNRERQNEPDLTHLLE